MNRQIFFLLFVLTATVCLPSCNKDDSEAKLLEEEQALDVWMKNNYADAEKLSNGLYVSVTKSSLEKKPDAGQHVLVNYELRLLDNRALEKTSYTSTDESPIEQSLYKFGGPELWQLTAPLAGIFAGIAQMSEEQRGTIFFSSRYNVLTGFVIDYRSRMLEMELVKIIPALSLYQDTLCHAHVVQKVQKVDTTVTRSVVTGADCSVMYGIISEGKGESLNGKGTVYAQVEAYYALQRNASVNFAKEDKINLKTYPNFSNYTADNYLDKILQPLKTGAHLRIAMPYVLFYGKDPQEDNGQVVVPMGSVVILDIKIVE
ncbi:MAG: hypothetical protein LBF89_03685 [Bacteroidales bacterium]|nr:hypothetical protein [Bacteroidales bacterium]